MLTEKLEREKSRDSFTTALLGRETIKVAAPQVHHWGPDVRFRLKQRARGSHSSVVLVTLVLPISSS